MIEHTDKEIEGLQGIVDSDFNDGNYPVKHWVWSWSANPFGSKRTFAGVVSSLVKKGLAQASGDAGDDACLTLTQAGWDLLLKVQPTEKNLKINALQSQGG